MRGGLLLAVAPVVPAVLLPLLYAAAAAPGGQGLPTHPDIPPVAVQAYVDGVAHLTSTTPGCPMPWWLLAGIGSVESDHGRVGGSALGGDGVARPPIIGIPLDGRGGTAAIADTDAGALDGDTAWDRAVGPMQFLPSTWARHGIDADGDGRADPHDITDAAASAAAYLCAARPGSWHDPDHARVGLLAYNASTAYAEEVLARGHAYRDEAALHAATDVGGTGTPILCPVAGPVSFIDSWGYPRPNGRTHKGQDLFAPRGTPLVALAAAQVLGVAPDAGLGGNVVWLGTGDGAAWYYAHLDAFAAGLHIGQHLTAGQPVGTVGDTGNARGTSPHLHIQWRPSGRRGADVNPYPLLDLACPGH